MAATIQIKRRPSSGAAGLSGVVLRSGELAMHEADNVLYIGTGDNGDGVATSITPVAGGGYVFPNSASYAILSASNTFTGTTNYFKNVDVTGTVAATQSISAGTSLSATTSVSAGTSLSVGTSATIGGDLSVNSGKFSVTATNGNTVVGGTFSAATNNFSVDASGNLSGVDADFSGTLSSGTNDSFSVDQSGNVIATSVTAGTLSAASAVFTVDGSGNTDVFSLDVNSGEFTVNSSGDAAAKGTLKAAHNGTSYLFQVSSLGDVTAAAISATGDISADGDISGQSLNINNVTTISSAGAIDVSSGNFTVSAAGSVTAAGDASVSGDLSAGLDADNNPIISTNSAGAASEFVVNTDTSISGDLAVSGKIYSNSAEVATKSYVDAVKTGLDVKDSVRVATTSTSGANADGSITLGSSTTSIDGVTLQNGDRVLVKNQTNAVQNGIYVVNTSGSWSRAEDANEVAEVSSGMFVFVEEGSVNADSGWVLTTDGSITVGSSALAFSQFSGTGAITDGVALTKTGSTLDVNVDDGLDQATNTQTHGTISVNANDELQISTRYEGQTSIVKVGKISNAEAQWEGTTIGLAYGGTGATTAAGARTALVVPGLATSNVLTGTNTFRSAAGTVFQEASATDGIIILGNGETEGFDATLTSDKLSADQIIRLPDETGTLLVSTAGHSSVCAEINDSCIIDCGEF